MLCFELEFVFFKHEAPLGRECWQWTHHMCIQMFQVPVWTTTTALGNCFNKWLIWPHARNFVYYNYWILKSREINKKSKEEQKHPEAHRLFFIACAGISLPVSILQSHLAWKRASLSHKIPSNLISLWALCVAAKADRDLSPLWVLLLSCITKKRAGKSTCKDVRTVSVKRELEHTSANPLVVLYLAIKHAYTHTHTHSYIALVRQKELWGVRVCGEPPTELKEHWGLGVRVQ